MLHAASPAAGTVIPVAGVSHVVGALLASPTLEEGLRILLDMLVGDQAMEVGLWIWPDPQISAIGLIGTARLYDLRRYPIARLPLADELLEAWTSAKRRTVTTRLGQFAALCLPVSAPPLTAEERQWYTLWTDWLAQRELTLRDAKLRALAEFAAGAGHEINNPLGTILGRSQLLQRKEADPERKRGLATIATQALRIRDMIADTMSFARPPVPQRERCDLALLIAELQRRFEAELKAARLSLSVQIDEPVTALIDREQFLVALVELLRNAIQVSPPSTSIGLRARTRTWQDREWVEIDLGNHGPPLTAAEREHLFDPFFSGRNAGRGLGFGLTKCWRIVQAHGGRIAVDSNPQRTIFRSLWPVD